METKSHGADSRISAPRIWGKERGGELQSISTNPVTGQERTARRGYSGGGMGERSDGARENGLPSLVEL